MSAPAIRAFLDEVRELLGASHWSRAIEVARTSEVLRESSQESSAIYRVRLEGRPVSPRVECVVEDLSWSCSCGEPEDPCLHVAIVAIALQNNRVKEFASTSSASPLLTYELTTDDGELAFSRVLLSGDGKKETLKTSLIEYLGGLEAGRIKGSPPAVSSEDFGIDVALGQRKVGKILNDRMPLVLEALSKVAHVSLDGSPVQVAAIPFETIVTLSDENEGFRLQAKSEVPERRFKNGAVLVSGVLRALPKKELNERDWSMLGDGGRFFAKSEISMLLTAVLPALEAKAKVVIQAKNLPTILEEAPSLRLDLENENETLTVHPRLVYGDPPYAEVESGELFYLGDKSKIPKRDVERERTLIKNLEQMLRISLGKISRFQGGQAIEFLEQAANFASRNIQLRGRGASAFQPSGALAPDLRFEGDRLIAEFQTKDGGRATAEQVFQVWDRGERFVRLLDGRWATIPRNWMDAYGGRLRQVLDGLAHAKTDDRAPMSKSRQELMLSEIAREHGLSCPERLSELRTALEQQQKLPELSLPNDLTISLRPYQETGVRWLSLHKELGLGALLADDMGLGKTLQALSVIGPGSLIVAPTSVVHHWVKQFAQFRPGLKVSLYHGGTRSFERSADVIVTSYGLLRQEISLFADSPWNTIVLDEAHTIKNPESLVSQAVRRLSTRHAIALTGTPIENHVADIWSIFDFLNPGLLGDLPPQSSGPEELSRIRMRVKPFILRRTKAVVATELPARTEMVIYTELDSREREVYEALYASTRESVLRYIGEKGSAISIFEAILRLRQACCHLGLVPGQKANTSSKFEALVEHIQTLLEEGHRMLIFSQWTSLLDLLEIELKQQNVRWSRLDGTTRDRAGVVDQFQTADGPPIMLLSLKAGGVGITLTAADHVFFLDSWWNPQVEAQAADRAHRIGQTNPVFIHRIIARNTIEERILLLQEEKKLLASQMLDDTDSIRSLKTDDLAFLFG